MKIILWPFAWVFIGFLAFVCWLPRALVAMDKVCSKLMPKWLETRLAAKIEKSIKAAKDMENNRK
jgi:small-conductance mechanosensitive channel